MACNVARNSSASSIWVNNSRKNVSGTAVNVSEEVKPLKSITVVNVIFTIKLHMLRRRVLELRQPLRKIKSTLPTGPLRCLEMMISAMFCLAVSFSYSDRDDR